MTNNYRIEHDLLGEREIPENVYWGIHTLRTQENFPISGVSVSLYPNLIKALALVKKSAATANQELELLEPEKAAAIVQACDDIINGQLHDQFVLDVIQGGAGTSTNMAANEIIANRGLELLGHPKGQYQFLHPVQDVNRSQSTNDVYPTAIKLGLSFAIVDLLAAMQTLQAAFEAKVVEFSDILKIGRTQLQDAVPMTVGQEFSTYAVMLAEDRLRLMEAAKLLLEINLGASAIGTGINTDPAYSKLACQRLAEFSALDIIPAENLIEATQDPGSFVQLSGVLKRVAIKLSKVCNDLRLLSSGPQAGFNEINLPARAAGSSIMPGKVNPIIPDVVNQVAFEVIGNDMTISMAAEGGQLQLNAFEPIIAHSLFKSINHLTSACQTLSVNCVSGITVNRERLSQLVNRSITLITALNPFIGYENTSKIAKEALKLNKSVVDLVIEHKLLTKDELDEILQPKNLPHPRKLFKK
ncbi:aspartate ammonia-lyase [Orbus mooreae]|uniref:aspartate ammonia-lyase n=1 Tax=Orbus mooreae TaxID=3074107 RepID=UPI00370DA2CB